MTVFVIMFVNLFQNLGVGYMKLLPEFKIYLQSKKNREDQISLYLRADSKAGAPGVLPPRLIIFFSILRQIFQEKNCSAPSCLINSRGAPGISFLIC